LRGFFSDLAKVKDMKKLVKGMESGVLGGPKRENSGIVEYLEDASKTDEHYFRMYESSECWGFENFGATMLYYSLPVFAGVIKGLEGLRGTGTPLRQSASALVTPTASGNLDNKKKELLFFKSDGGCRNPQEPLEQKRKH
jgi:hypothetical protein